MQYQPGYCIYCPRTALKYSTYWKVRESLYQMCETKCLLLGIRISMASLTTFLCPFSLSGFRQRRREVLWESSSPPETCPHLVESIPCEDPTCYMWQVQQEERCIPSRKTCGPGSAVQNMTCVHAEGNVHHKGTVPVKINMLHAYMVDFCSIPNCKESFSTVGRAISAFLPLKPA